jgi:hypothetical protein
MGKPNKITFVITIDDRFDGKKIRDFMMEKFRKLDFIDHAQASFGVFSKDLTARDYKQERVYENIPREVLAQLNERDKLERHKEELEEMIEKVEEKLALEL